ncbi:PDT-domain-containing protein [Dentipellis sp. KUC8613]|nr:PDT-domain-containing protein [Dentipellis sp. KUC8613]
MSQPSTRPAPKLAYLGPVGTYSHQIAYDTFGDAVEYEACASIADVFDAVGAAVPLALLPQENSIFGAVVETADLLRAPALGASVWICGAAVLGVQHCLLVRRGVPLARVEQVLSHEQALGQCRQFLAEHLPGAVTVKVASTSAAAERVASEPEGERSAAICSAFCARVYKNLEVLHEGIQNADVNHTRFYIACSTPTLPVPLKQSDEESPRCALIRMEVGPPFTADSSATLNPSLTDLLAGLRFPPTRIDRRPSLHHASLDYSTYLVEIIDDGVRTRGSRRGCEEWAREVSEAVRRVNDAGGEARVLGYW